ncbi:MAG: alpha-galactosidase [Armatimonadetes bacterium]|nr:alpha-galactosidase [Armatimonadota bacterium]MDE2205717.1 alpha-galactosidase [Armatimonadota bacterium]
MWMLVAALCGGTAMQIPANRISDQASSLPALSAAAAKRVSADWLVSPLRRRAVVAYDRESGDVVMTNGLIRRDWRLAPNGACVRFTNLMTGAAILRGVSPEARVTINGNPYDVGGLTGQPDYAYLKPQWLPEMKSDAAAFQCTGITTGKTVARFPWKPRRYCANTVWPPPGAAMVLHFTGVGAVAAIDVDVHYEMYDGIPLIAKWITVTNTGKATVRLDRFENERLAVVEHGTDKGTIDGLTHPNLYAESDYEFGGGNPAEANHTIHWEADPRYTTQVDYSYKTPCLLVSEPPLGPAADIAPGSTFESYRTYELVFDSGSRQRNGLALCRMYRSLAPWATENPLLMHCTRSDPASVRAAIDQAAACGFEVVILSFGSGFNPENMDPAYIAQFRDLVNYAHSRGIDLGGYDLLASRSIDPQDDVINPKTLKPGGAIFGSSPCLCSAWGIAYFKHLKQFMAETGMRVLEHDGSYPGDVCASTTHPGHRGLDDSQWNQWKMITDFYHWCRATDIYLNVPDWYFLNGSNKTGMGYREDNWSLPRERQIVLGRQEIFDGTWYKTPSMGWMFVPLVQYHGGGEAATLEPLKEHLNAYAAHLIQNLGMGVQACYRGTRLYDAPETEAVVRKWVDFYEAHRAILDSDVIHLRRADGATPDAMMHVNPNQSERAMALVWNPEDTPVTETLTLPLYYTGITNVALVSINGAAAHNFRLDREYKIDVKVAIPAHGFTWLLVRDGRPAVSR